MRRILLLLVVLFSLNACAALEPQEASPYQLLIASADLSPQTPRLALVLWDGPEKLTGVQSLQVGLYTVGSEGEVSEKLWEGAATSYQMGDIQYWIAYPDFPAAGTYGVQATFKTAEGRTFENTALLSVKPAPEAPSVGAVAPPSQTRTLADAPIEALTSAGPYREHFYEMSVADAVASGKPTIVAFSTPGHCTTQLCAPVLESVAAVSEEVGDAVNVVHVEIYRDFAAGIVEPAVEEWGLPSEPWVFVLKADGTVGARLDSMVSPEELRQAVQAVRGG